MGKVLLDLTMSLDGFVAGVRDDDRPERELEAMDRLHEWMFPPKGDFEAIGRERFEGSGAVVVGKRMFRLGEAPWGDDPPFHRPVYVVTHEAREPLVKQGGTTYYFANEGVEGAVAEARQAAGGQNVLVLGGADIAQQCLKAGLLDELYVHVAPVLLGEGIRLFDNLGADPIALEPISVTESGGAAHLRYRVVV